MKYFVFIFLILSIIACQNQSNPATTTEEDTQQKNIQQSDSLIKIINNSDTKGQFAYINIIGTRLRINH